MKNKDIDELVKHVNSFISLQNDMKCNCSSDDFDKLDKLSKVIENKSKEINKLCSIKNVVEYVDNRYNNDTLKKYITLALGEK